MTLFACGINHNTAELTLRERVVIPSEQLPQLLSDLLAQTSVSEAVVLSTCNRTEIYADAASADSLLAALAKHCNVDSETLKDASYHYSEQDMVRHVMRVACGLDSMILGEPQIFGQLKEAVMLAEKHSAVGPQLAYLFRQVFNVGKAVRTHTEVGACPMSVASTAVSLAKKVLTDLEKANVLLIGAGDTAALMAKHLNAQGVKNIVIASRKLDKAEKLAMQFSAAAITLQQLTQQLPIADVIFSATASILPVLGKGAVETALIQRGNKPMVMIDIAVPRDIEPEVSTLDGVHLYAIDDLKQVIQQNAKNREHAAEKAEAMIIQETKNYMMWLRSLDSVSTIRAFREWVDALREEELEKAISTLKKGVAPEIAMRRMANALSNKLMHPPSVKLREASSEGRTEFVEHVQELFDLDME